MNWFEQLENRNLLAVMAVNISADNITSDNDLTLREAVAIVNAGTTAGVIPGLARVLSAAEIARVDATTPFGTNDKIDLTTLNTTINVGNELEVTKSVLIDGPGAPTLTIDGNGIGRIFNFTVSTVDISIDGVTLTGGDSGAGKSGGAVFSAAAGLLTISDSIITGNAADLNGGGIYAASDVLLTGTKIGDPTAGTGNDAINGAGGGLFALGNVTVRNSSSVTGNQAPRGGGIFGGADVSVESSTIGGTAAGSPNKALTYDGGGIYAVNISLVGATIAGNTAASDGGGIYALGNATLNDTLVANNTATGGDGGGLWAAAAATLTNKSRVLDNAAGDDGGGIFASANVSVTGSTVSGNTAVSDGGGIFTNDGNVNLDSSTVGGSAAASRNRATNGDGGGIFARVITAQNSTISGNEAGDDGGGLRSRTTATIRNSTVSGNKANDDGGGIYGFNVTAQNTTIASNRANASGAGGGIGGGVDATNRLTMRNSIVIGNSDDANTNPDVRSPGSTSVRFSMIADKRGTTFTATGPTTPDAATGNLIGDALDATKDIPIGEVLDSLLGVAILKNNNGVQPASTETIALIAGSHAIDKGSNSLIVGPELGDQRGLPFARIFGAQVDMGAFEVQTDSPEISVQAIGSSVASGGTATILGTVTGSITVPVRIFNTGTAVLNLTGTPRVVVSGANAADFAVVSQPPATIAANDSATFDVTFTPSASGVRTATLTIANNDSDEGIYTVILQGTGNVVAVGTPEINVQVNNVNVATGGTAANVGATNGTITVPIKIQNTGTGALNLTGAPLFVTVSGANASDFVVTQPASGTIAAGNELTFNVSFMPTGNGLRTATLSIPNSDATGGENPYTIVLEGTGAGVVAASPEINLQVNGADIISGGTADLGATNITLNRTVTIQNVGTGALSLTGAPLLVSVSGANAGDFVVTQPVSNTVAAGNSITFNVAFTPSGNGVRTAVLTIPNNDSNENPYTITLQGNNGSVGSSTLFSENFDDGTVDPKITPQSGTFALSGTTYSGTRNNTGQNAIATIESLTLPSHFRVDATVNMAGGNGSSLWSNGLIIFDYVDANNFKYAGAFEIVDKYIIGQVVNGRATHLVQSSASLAANSNVNLSLEINGAVATLSANGSQVVTRTFKSSFTGRVGVGTLNANTRFDNIVVTQLT